MLAAEETGRARDIDGEEVAGRLRFDWNGYQISRHETGSSIGKKRKTYSPAVAVDLNEFSFH
jgi:hypothetical protein